jgi:hypothetical protein
MTAPIAYSFIRFSTPEQAKGNSLRRQLEASEKFAAEKGLILDSSFRDLGKSASKGEHVGATGALGRFIKLVEEGKIALGSWLIIEAMDRLDRRDVPTANEQFTRLLRAGVIVHTLMDNQTYTYERICKDLSAMLVSIIQMAMAYDYTEKLKNRIKQVWQARRTDMRAGKCKATNAGPTWLTAIDGKWEPIDPTKLAVIERIKQDRLLGLGSHAIATRLNTIDPVPSFASKTGWHPATVDKLVRSPALRGVYQPYRLDGTPDGEPIADFYPRVMSDADWWRMQWPVGGAKASPGKQTEGVKNLLHGVCKCHCGATLVFLDKGGKRGPHLVCSKSRRGLCFDKTTHTYSTLEADLLTALSLFDVSVFTQQGNPHIDRIAATRAQLADLAATITALVDNFSANTPRSVAERITRLEGEQDALRASLEVMERESHIAEANEQQDAHAAFTGMLEGMAAMPSGEERKVLRLRIAAHLRNLIETAVAVGPDLVFTLKAGPHFQVQLVAHHSKLISLRVGDADLGCVHDYDIDYILSGEVAGLFAEHVAVAA